MTTEDRPAATAEDHPGPGETAEATPPTINWPGWLEKYRALAQADWDATRENDARDKDASKKTVRRLERAIDESGFTEPQRVWSAS